MHDSHKKKHKARHYAHNMVAVLPVAAPSAKQIASNLSSAVILMRKSSFGLCSIAHQRKGLAGGLKRLFFWPLGLQYAEAPLKTMTRDLIPRVETSAFNGSTVTPKRHPSTVLRTYAQVKRAITSPVGRGVELTIQSLS